MKKHCFFKGTYSCLIPMYFDRNISEKGSCLSCVTNGEFHFSPTLANANAIAFAFCKRIVYINFCFILPRKIGDTTR